MKEHIGWHVSYCLIVAMTKGQRRANRIQRNRQVSLGTDQHKGQNTNAEVREQHVDPQGMKEPVNVLCTYSDTPILFCVFSPKVKEWKDTEEISGLMSTVVSVLNGSFLI